MDVLSWIHFVAMTFLSMVPHFGYGQTVIRITLQEMSMLDKSLQMLNSQMGSIRPRTSKASEMYLMYHRRDHNKMQALKRQNLEHNSHDTRQNVLIEETTIKPTSPPRTTYRPIVTVATTKETTPKPVVKTTQQKALQTVSTTPKPEPKNYCSQTCEDGKQSNGDWPKLKLNCSRGLTRRDIEKITFSNGDCGTRATNPAMVRSLGYDPCDLMDKGPETPATIFITRFNEMCEGNPGCQIEGIDLKDFHKMSTEMGCPWRCVDVAFTCYP